MRLARLSLLMNVIAILTGVGMSNVCDAMPYQAHDAFKAAIEDNSTSPYIVLIEVVDDRTGQTNIGCTSANFLRGAVYLEKWGSFEPSVTPETHKQFDEVRKIIEGNTSHIFHFSSDDALNSILPFKYNEALSAISEGKRARVVDRTGKIIYGPFVEGPSITWGKCPSVAYPL